MLLKKIYGYAQKLLCLYVTDKVENSGIVTEHFGQIRKYILKLHRF